MRDYTSNKYFDFLWISDLLELKRNDKNEFRLKTREGENSLKSSVVNVTIFGTIVEVKSLGYKGFLYQVDDGTGVIACKHSEEQFEEILNLIENEKVDVLNQTVDVLQRSEQSYVTATSADDSVFNDQSIQAEDINFDKKSRLQALQSIWDDIYKSFFGLIEQYSIGDSVLIQGKLYTYFNTNQIYINCIRAMEVGEEIMYMTIKLEDSFSQKASTDIPKPEVNSEKRLSGFVTFDNILHLNPKIFIPGNIEVPKLEDVLNITPGVVTPNLEPVITFDTFSDSP